MHTLVKETTGIDFSDLGNDLKVAKEFTLKALGAGLDNKDKSATEGSPSLGNLLNEVNLSAITMHGSTSFMLCI